MSADLLSRLAMLEAQLSSVTRSVAGLTEDIPGVGDMLPQKFLHEGGGAGAFVIPKGIIVMWSGSTAPGGWHLCNGSNDTPDLRGRFIVGYDPDHVEPSTLPDNNEPYTNPGDLSTGGATSGNFGGRLLHGYTENNHNDHDYVVDWNHTHKLLSAGINETDICVDQPVDDVCATGNKITVPALSASDYGETDGVSDSSTPAVPGDSAVDSTGSLDEGEHSNVGAKYSYTLKHTGATTEDTDNRPPYYVLAYIMKA
jgi:hypothetical protein